MLNKSSCKSLLRRHAETLRAADSAPSTHVVAKQNNDQSGRSRIKYGMTLNHMGFTLIELLVVILIIGILASIALPQYQKAVEKSRATQALVLLKSIVQAQEAYYLANGNYALKFDELAVDIPWTGTTRWGNANIYDTFSNEDWSVQIWGNSEVSSGVYVGRISGKYKGGGFVYYFKKEGTSPTKQILCAERVSSGVAFEGGLGNYCKKIFQGSYIHNIGIRLFTLPQF